MIMNDIIQVIFFFLIIIFLTKPLGYYMTQVFSGQTTIFSFILNPIEKIIYRLIGIDPKQNQHWLIYAFSLIIFNLIGFLTLFSILRFQDLLPYNLHHLPALNASLAFNTALSFITNTNWQNYVGEKELSYFSQMVGLTVQNFLSAATGITVAIALIRGFSQELSSTIGNFWVDLTRCILYVLLPISFMMAFIFITQGVPQNFLPAVEVTTLENSQQIISQGPVASQLAIKMLGTNGGGFFNVNSAHPYENPNALTNFLELILMVVLGAALTNVFGRMTGNQKQGWVIFITMGILFLGSFALNYSAEIQPNPIVKDFLDQHNIPSKNMHSNMEGKEVRFGILGSTLFSTATTATSTGATNSLHTSFMPLTGFILFVNMLVGEVIFGGVGSGFYGMILFVVLSVFVAGLMIGRTPEYIGKKIEAKEMKMTILALLVSSLILLCFTALASVTSQGLAAIYNKGPHGFSEILYLFTSSVNNNGSAFTGISSNSDFYNILGGIAMFLGRYTVIIPMLSIAGSLAKKKRNQSSSGTLQTDQPLFIGLLIGIILIVGGLTYLPALTLGPITDHLMMLNHKNF
ncbi:MAG: potassium-transporting ATPase subunit KdpA [Alphaproteobacteria bacterium]|nr:potassium-transporting ATPase subunit KdpA [Alphaproteobacteria bacterium]